MVNLGWIKLYRELKSKSIWQRSSSQQKVVLITILMTVNHEENKWEWKGEEFICKPGQMITSLESLAKECGKDVTIQNVRTAIERFKKLGFLTNESTKTGRLITVVNWDKYQGNDYETNKETNKQLTKSQQRSNKQLTTIKEYKNDKNEKKCVCSETTSPPTLDMLLSFSLENFKGYSESDLKKSCTKFLNYYKDKGWDKVKKWKSKLKLWIDEDIENKKFIRIEVENTNDRAKRIFGND